MTKIYFLNQFEVDTIESCLTEIKCALQYCPQNYIATCALDAVNKINNVFTSKEITDDNN